MSPTLHFFERSRLSQSIVEGQDMLGLCGTVVQPQTQGGHIFNVTTPGSDMCGRCLATVRTWPLAKRRPKRLSKIVATAPAAEA